MRIRITRQPSLTAKARCLLQQGISSVKPISDLLLMRKENGGRGFIRNSPIASSKDRAATLDLPKEYQQKLIAF
jgi:hypothetical protein